MSGTGPDQNVPKSRLRAEVHVTGCDTDNCLVGAYDSTVIASFIMAFAKFIGNGRCKSRSFVVELSAYPATTGTKVGTFNEPEWRDILITESGEVELQAVVDGPLRADGMVEARYTFLLVNPQTP